MNIILVPQWVEQAIEAHGDQLGMVLTDLDRLSAILSPIDVAFYVYINRNAEHFLGDSVVQSFENCFPSTIFEETTVSDGWRCYYEEHSLGKAPDPQTVWFGEALGIDGSEGHVRQKPSLTADMLSYDTVIVRPVQSRIAVDNENSMQTLYDRLNALLYTRCTFEDLAQKPIFAEWLRAVSSS